MSTRKSLRLMIEHNTGPLICYNSHYALAVRRVAKGLSIIRLSDDARLATIFVRDPSFVASYQWDQYSGKFFIVFYTDGTARIFNCFTGGKLVSLLRISTKKVAKGVWDRVPTGQLSKVDICKFDFDITKLMPLMIKFAKQSRIVPYEPPNSAWRQLSTEERRNSDNLNSIFDVHLVYEEDCHEFVIMFDGDYVLNIPGGPSAEHTASMKKIMTIEHGYYYAFREDGSFESLDLRPLMQCTLTTSLIGHIIAMRQLCRYLQENLEVIRRDLTLPYIEFLTRVCDNEYDIERLNEELMSLLVNGEVSNELENWLCSSIGEKNLQKWSVLGSEAYQRTTQVLTLAFIPACERFIILAERTRGILKALQLNEEQMIVELVEFSTLISLLQSVLQTTLQTVSATSSEEILFKSFLEWIADKVKESIDEGYKPKMKLDTRPNIASDLSKFFECQFRRVPQLEALENFARISTFDGLLKQVSGTLELISDQYTRPRILKKIMLLNHPTVFTDHTTEQQGDNKVKLVELTTATSLPLILYVVSSQDVHHITTYSAGTLDKALPCKVRHDKVIFNMPSRLGDEKAEHVQIWHVYDAFENKLCSAKTAIEKFSVQFSFEGRIAKEDTANSADNSTLVSFECRLDPNKNISIKENAQNFDGIT